MYFYIDKLGSHKFTMFTVGRGLAPAETYGLRLERREQAPALRCIVNLHKPMVSDAMYVLPTMCVGHDDPACHKIRA